MFLTTRKIPLIAVKCEALIRNLPLDYPKITEINSVHSKLMAGYYGEKSLDYHLSALNQEKFDIYPGLRLSNRGQYFQMDSLVISTHYLLIMEVKNLKGELEFDSSKGQLIQKIDDKNNVYDDPFAQVQKQKIHLLQWLEEHKFPPIPVETLVVLSKNNALIKKVTGASVNHWKLSRCINVLEKIATFDRMYQTECISVKDMKKLGKILLKKDTPLDKDILSYFKIPKDDTLTGLTCQLCLNSPMEHIYGTWQCPVCYHKSKTAHEQKLLDYFLIINHSISNKQFRALTHLNDRQVANRILNSMNLHHQGTNRGRIYFPPKTQLSVLLRSKKAEAAKQIPTMKKQKKPEAQRLAPDSSSF